MYFSVDIFYMYYMNMIQTPRDLTILKIIEDANEAVDPDRVDAISSTILSQDAISSTISTRGVTISIV